MSSLKKYVCQVNSDQFIEYEYNIFTKSCWINDMFLDIDLLRPFFILFELSVSELHEKGIDYFVQTVSISEWESFLQSDDGWRVLNKNEEDVTIECNIFDAPACFASGLGINL
jgi:hypothetical protein